MKRILCLLILLYGCATKTNPTNPQGSQGGNQPQYTYKVLGNGLAQINYYVNGADVWAPGNIQLPWSISISASSGMTYACGACPLANGTATVQFLVNGTIINQATNPTFQCADVMGIIP